MLDRAERTPSLRHLGCLPSRGCRCGFAGERLKHSWKPIDKKADWTAWKALLGKAKVRYIRLHDARHTAATLLLSAGVHPRVVMELLGHSQIRTTTDTYSHVMPTLAKEAAGRLRETLWG